MGLNYVHRIIILVFSVSLTVNFSKVSANENSQQYVPCKQGWYFFDEKCYKLLPLDLDAGLSWLDSATKCVYEGGHLASIHSNELQDFLTTFLLLNAKSNAWIGLHDRIMESKFSWEADMSLSNYTNWDDKQPSRISNSNEEDCVEMRYRNSKDGIGKWNDESCNSLRPYICQKDKNDATMSPDPRFCSIEDGGGWKYLNSCYHIVKEEKSWEDAEKYCEEKYKGYIVSILEDSEEFLDYIMKFSNLSQNVWIGIKLGNYSMQKWTSGWHVTNKKFNQERMHFVNGTCAVKSNWNTWAIAPCHNQYPFICEKIKYNVPVLQKPPSDDWKCPQSSKKWLDLGGDSCYYVELESKKNWLEANYECGRKGGTLASFQSENETNILHPHVLDTEDRVLIGLKRNSVQKDVFEWADGTKVSYENWHKGEPNGINEICGELWTDSMKWNDVPCNIAKGYICKTKKVFTYSKTVEVANQPVADVPCNSALSRYKICSGGIPAGIVVGIVFFTLLVGLFVGVIVYHYHDYLKRYCTKTEKDGFTSTAPGSLGHVSDKVIWTQEGEELHY